MLRTNDLANPADVVQWRPSAPPFTACFLQAVLASGALAVVAQALINLVWSVPAMTIHLTVFVVSLPAIWWLQLHRRAWFEPAVGLSLVRFTPQGIDGEITGQGRAVPLEVVEVGRYWGALALKLKPLEPLNPLADVIPARSTQIVVWKAILGQETFRKLSVLALWHARRIA